MLADGCDIGRQVHSDGTNWTEVPVVMSQSGIAWDLALTYTFDGEKEESIFYVQYYKNKYRLTLCDAMQPI